MLLIIIFADRWVVRHFSLGPTTAPRLETGIIALAFLLAVEFTIVLKIRHRVFEGY